MLENCDHIVLYSLLRLVIKTCDIHYFKFFIFSLFFSIVILKSICNHIKYLLLYILLINSIDQH